MWAVIGPRGAQQSIFQWCCQPRGSQPWEAKVISLFFSRGGAASATGRLQNVSARLWSRTFVPAGWLVGWLVGGVTRCNPVCQQVPRRPVSPPPRPAMSNLFHKGPRGCRSFLQPDSWLVKLCVLGWLEQKPAATRLLWNSLDLPVLDYTWTTTIFPFLLRWCEWAPKFGLLPKCSQESPTATSHADLYML